MIEKAIGEDRAYYAFLHKESIAPGVFPVVRLYLIDESQSVFIALSNDR
jgi:hypothetical protein